MLGVSTCHVTCTLNFVVQVTIMLKLNTKKFVKKKTYLYSYIYCMHCILNNYQQVASRHALVIALQLRQTSKKALLGSLNEALALITLKVFHNSWRWKTIHTIKKQNLLVLTFELRRLNSQDEVNLHTVTVSDILANEPMTPLTDWARLGR